MGQGVDRSFAVGGVDREAVVVGSEVGAAHSWVVGIVAAAFAYSSVVEGIEAAAEIRSWAAVAAAFRR
jgi:hypothetical protein